MELSNKVILVTGGAGFIGSHLVDRLLKENPYRVIVLDNLCLGKLDNLSDSINKIDVEIGDATNFGVVRDIIEKYRIDIVFNLACDPLPKSLEKPEECFKNNVDITFNLCNLLRKRVFKYLVQFSSSEAYGTCMDSPMTEEHPLKPITPYAASKVAGDHLVQSYFNTFLCNCRIIRPFNAYGPRQNEGQYAGVIPVTIKRILNGEEPIIYGDGLQTRDFTYVTDVASATVEICKTEKSMGEVFNVCSEYTLTITKLVNTISSLMKYSGRKKYLHRRAGDVDNLIGSMSKAKKIADIPKFLDLEIGLKNTIDWYKDYDKS